MRYIVSQLLNTWVVRDKELLKRKKRSIVEEFTDEDAAHACAARLNIEEEKRS